MPVSDRIHRASRCITAEPEAIYDAFMNPEALVRWLPPDGATGYIEIFEPRDGGKIKINLTFASATGKSTETADVIEARFVSLVPGERIGLPVQFVSNDPRFAGTMTMTWRLETAAIGKVVPVTADDVPSGINRAEHEVGIASTLSNLAKYVEPRSGVRAP